MTTSHTDPKEGDKSAPPFAPSHEREGKDMRRTPCCNAGFTRTIIGDQMFKACDKCGMRHDLKERSAPAEKEGKGCDCGNLEKGSIIELDSESRCIHCKRQYPHSVGTGEVLFETTDAAPAEGTEGFKLNMPMVWGDKLFKLGVPVKLIPEIVDMMVRAESRARREERERLRSDDRMTFKRIRQIVTSSTPSGGDADKEFRQSVIDAAYRLIDRHEGITSLGEQA